MNERIDKLIEQCTKQNFSDCIGGFETFDKEKFAELIVRECIARVQLQNRMDETTEQWVYDNLVDDFKEHFGVKE